MISNRLFAVFVLALCMLSLYGVTFSGPYLSDDYWLIAKTSKDLSAWGIVEGLVTPLPEDVNPRFYREAWRVSYFLDIGVFDLNPFLSRLFNGLLHLVNGLLLFLLYKKLSGKPAVALFGAALFVVFPVHVEAVAWVAARCDLLALLFSLWALNLYASALSSGFTRRVRLGIGLCVFLACQSKETGVISVPALTALHWFFSPRGAEPMHLGARVRDVCAGTWWVWVWLASYMAMRFWVLGTFLGGYEGQRDPLTIGGLVEHLGRYGAALAFPISSLQSVLPGSAMVVLVGVGVVVTYMAIGSTGRSARVCRFTIVWMALSLLPLYGLKHVAPRLLYYPAAIWCLFLALTVHWIVSGKKKFGWPWISVALFGGLIGYSWITSQAYLRSFREGAEVGAAVIDQARKLLDENDGKPVVLYDIPDHSGPCYVGRNAFPNCCWPPFHRQRSEPFVGVTDTRLVPQVLETELVAIAFRSDSLYRRWNPDLETFVEASPPLLPEVVRGKLVIDEEGGLRLMPALVRVEGAMLLPLVDQFVILDGDWSGPRAAPLFSVKNARNAQPMLALASEGPVSGSITVSVTGEPGDAVGLWASAKRGLFSMGSAGTLLLEAPIPWQDMRIPTAGTHEFTFGIPPSVPQGEVFLQALIYRRGEWQLGDLLVVEVGG